MREFVMRLSSRRVLIGIVGLLGAVAVAVLIAQVTGDDEPGLDVSAGGAPAENPRLAGDERGNEPAATAEEAMQRALSRTVGRENPERPPGEECRKVTASEIRDALAANPNKQRPRPGWLGEVPEDLEVWVCPLLFPPGGRGVAYIAAEPTPHLIGGVTMQRVIDTTDDSDDTSQDPPPLNEVQAPPT